MGRHVETQSSRAPIQPGFLSSQAGICFHQGQMSDLLWQIKSALAGCLQPHQVTFGGAANSLGLGFTTSTQTCPVCFLTPNLHNKVGASQSFPVFKPYDWVAKAMGECQLRFWWSCCSVVLKGGPCHIHITVSGINVVALTLSFNEISMLAGGGETRRQSYKTTS